MGEGLRPTEVAAGGGGGAGGGCCVGAAHSPGGTLGLGSGCGPTMPACTREARESDREPWRENRICESAMETLSSQMVT